MNFQRKLVIAARLLSAVAMACGQTSGGPGDKIVIVFGSGVAIAGTIGGPTWYYFGCRPNTIATLGIAHFRALAVPSQNRHQSEETVRALR